MVTIVRYSLLSCLIIVIAGSCAPLIVKGKLTETIEPSRIHESCMELSPGQIFEYSFGASRPLNFNVHYHEDHNVFYVISKDAVAEDQGEFQPEKELYYCLMWMNPNSQPVTFSYHYSVRKPQ